ncbi:MAG: hypothetical protein M1836_002229 [Candelina mexicana]|nr:MAG: hypothetical protein M1836_002229 [Candelina mexicana]
MEEADIPSEWSNHRTLRHLKHNPAAYLHEDQYKPEDARCIVQFTHRGEHRQIEGSSPKGKDFDLCFSFEGGTDDPNIALTLRFFPLRVRDTDDRPVTERMIAAERDKITARFFGWTEGFNVSPQRREHPMPPAFGSQRDNLGPDNFSAQVNDFSFYRYTNSSLKDSGRSAAIDGNIDQQMVASWKFNSCVVHHGNYDSSNLSHDARNAADILSSLTRLEGPTRVLVHFRVHGHLYNAANRFWALPYGVPTWWRWVDPFTTGQEIVTMERFPPCDNTNYFAFFDKVGTEDSHRLGSYDSRISFSSEREYEVFIKGGLFTSIILGEDLVRTTCSGNHPCRLLPANILYSGAKSDEFLIGVKVALTDSERQAGNKYPDVATPTTITFYTTDAGLEVWYGKTITPIQQITDMGYPILILAVRPIKVTGMIANYTQYRAHFAFDQQRPSYAKSASAISWLMSGEPTRGISKESRLKYQILGRNNRAYAQKPLYTDHLPDHWQRIVVAWSQTWNLNPEQEIGFVNILSSKGGLNVMIGPSGTGKTYTIVAVVAFCLEHDIPLFVAAGSNCACIAIVEEILKHIFPRLDQPKGVYRLLSPSKDVYIGEGGDEGVYADQGDQPEILDELDHRILNTVITSMKGVEAPQKASILRQIQLMIRRFRNNMTRQFSEEEQRLINNLVYRIDTAKVVTAVEEGELPAANEIESITVAYRRVERCLVRCAKVIVSTCAASTNPLLFNFRPQIGIIDEGSQIPEWEGVLVPAVFAGSLVNLTIIGDTKQLGPTILGPYENVFFQQGKLSLMDRLMRTGVPTHSLITQYRMHPTIADVPNHSFYEGRLRNAQLTCIRPQLWDFRVWWSIFRGLEEVVEEQHSIFVSVIGSQSQVERGGTSRVNFPNLIAGLNILDSLCSWLNNADVLLLAPYALQIQFYRAITNSIPKYNNVRCMTVDSSQGTEATYVILDLVATGGKEEDSLGFIEQARRINVALSRSRCGLITLGRRDMLDRRTMETIDGRKVLKRETPGSRAWKYYLETHGHNEYRVNEIQDKILRDAYIRERQRFTAATPDLPIPEEIDPRWAEEYYEDDVEWALDDRAVEVEYEPKSTEGLGPRIWKVDATGQRVIWDGEEDLMLFDD